MKGVAGCDAKSLTFWSVPFVPSFLKSLLRETVTNWEGGIAFENYYEHKF